MLKSKSQRFGCFFIAAMLIFLMAFVVNSTAYFSNQYTDNFDWWSDSLIYSDIIYHKAYPNERAEFTKSLNPTRLAELYGGVDTDYENSVRTAYENGDNLYKESDFEEYTSNIVIQRYFFRFLDRVLPISNTSKIFVFYFLNCLLLAIAVSVIICWIIKKMNNFIIGIAILFLFSLFAPNLIMYGKNLYWCAWTLFLPVVIMILLIESKMFKRTRHKALLLSVFACGSIIIKCLFYFEFVSVVMISMMIPVIFYLLNEGAENYALKKRMLDFSLVSAAAVIGFALVFFIRLILLNSYYNDLSEAIGSIVFNLENRLFGNADAENSSIVASSEAPIILVLKRMVRSTFIDIRYYESISQFALILNAGVSTFMLLLMNTKTHILSKKHFCWIVCCWVSLLAPFSWFILAKPHTYIHHVHCTITWFVIFDFMAVSVIAMFIEQMVKILKNEYRAKKQNEKIK